jgi:hypothetical protein
MQPTYAKLLNPQALIDRFYLNTTAMELDTYDLHKADILIVHPFVKAYCQTSIYRDDITTLDVIDKIMGLEVQTTIALTPYEAILLSRSCVFPQIEKGEQAYSRLNALTYPLAVRKFNLTKEL